MERLGPDDGEVAFQGTFSGPNAEARVREFDNLRLSGGIVWLTWQTFRRRVIVKNFVAEYHNPWWISYKISCVVAHQAGTAFAVATTAFAYLSADLNRAVAAVAGTAVSITPLQTALSDGSAIIGGTSGNAQASAAAQTSLDTINGLISDRSATMTADLEANTTPVMFSSAFTSVVGNAGSLAAATNARCYVGRIKTILSGSGD